MVLNIKTLQQRVSGQVFTPDDVGYHTARQAWNRTTDQYPALILMADNVQDVITGVNYAREFNLGVGVQSTGHGTQQPFDDALMIVTSRLKAVSVDAEAGTAYAGAGVLWGAVVEAAAPYGLAPLLGSAPHVGVVGYTLGGGIGWLARQYGLAADSVRWIELVTPDGVLRHASPTENSELFWGLRGGGGNFGVVTALEFDLYPVAALYGGHLLYPGSMVGDVLRFYPDWVNTLPDAMTSSVQIVKVPDLPVVPEDQRGQVLVFVRAAYADDPAEGATWMQPWLDWQTPASNTFTTMPFTEIGTISNDPVEPSAGYGSHETVDTLTDTLIDIIVRQMTDATSPLTYTELRHAAGAVARVPTRPSAVSNRSARFFLQMAGLAPTPEHYLAVKHAIHHYKHALRPHVRGGVYLNFMKGEEAAARVTDAYSPETFERLLALKARYDPQNLFRFSYQLVTDR